MMSERREIAITKLQNHFLGDSLCDWLEKHGREQGFVPDRERPDYRACLDFTLFIREKFQQFERRVLESLIEKAEFAVYEPADDLNLEIVKSALDQMRQGKEVLYKAQILNDDTGLYGSPWLLVRADVLNRFVDEPAISQDASHHPAPALGNPWHYRVVECLYRSGKVQVKGGVDVSDKHKFRLWALNQALGAMQGYTPPTGYFLCRNVDKKLPKGEWLRSQACFDRLACLDLTALDYSEKLMRASDWIRRLEAEGENWQVLPVPSLPELWPGSGDSQWSHTVKEIAVALEDPALLRGISTTARFNGIAESITKFSDPRCTAERLGVPKEPEICQAILDANQRVEPPYVFPAEIKAEGKVWGKPGPVEFFVDFETITDVDDDFETFPQKGGQPLIFMVGCGHIENGEWHFRCFVADSMTMPAEARVIEEWREHMSRVKARLDPEGPGPLVFHWSPAESSFMEDSYMAAAKRHHRPDWCALHWFDFWKRVIKAEPVTVKGAHNFGLKSMAKALYNLGAIQTSWPDSSMDGLGAMTAAFACARQSRELGVPMSELPLMREIISYNEIDCRTMMEIISYLRKHHLGVPESQRPDSCRAAPQISLV